MENFNNDPSFFGNVFFAGNLDNDPVHLSHVFFSLQEIWIMIQCT